MYQWRVYVWRSSLKVYGLVRHHVCTRVGGIKDWSVIERCVGGSFDDNFEGTATVTPPSHCSSSNHECPPSTILPVDFHTKPNKLNVV